MTPRSLPVTLLVAFLLCLPAQASQPQRLVGKLIGNPNVVSGGCPDGLPLSTIYSFAWTEILGEHQLDPAHTVAVDLALIPFRSGETSLTLNAIGGASFLNVTFADGLVKGIPYNRSTWNDVLVRLRPATQDYTITVNGVSGGPFPYSNPCDSSGTCFTLQSMQFLAPSSGDDAVAWLDSFTIYDEATIGYGNIFELDFDRCFRPDVSYGGILISNPPRSAGKVKLATER